MSLQFESLNENQRSAVCWGDGPLLVLAGPGSGKTQVLTVRAARLIEEREDTSVLALTFTTKAADEMRERVDGLLGGRADRAHLCTFHSFAGDVLRQHGSHLGIQPDFMLLTQDEDRVAILEGVVNQLSGDLSDVPQDRRNLLTLIDRLFAESYDGGLDAPVLANTPYWLPALFAGYCNTLKECNRLDYGALLCFARQLLEKRPAVARLLRHGWSHISVDEFQDTNRAQYDLLKLLVGGGSPNLFVVADDDQIIYQWNGASPERLQALRNDYDMQVIQLPRNYRCPSIVITLANNLIRHNTTRTSNKSPLVAHRTDDTLGVLFAIPFRDEDEEANAIPGFISERGILQSDCVVLGRSSKVLNGVARALAVSGYTPYLAQRKNEFDSNHIRWFYAILRLANVRHDRELLRRVCVAWQSLTEVVIEVGDIEADAALLGGDFFRAWLEVANTKLENTTFKPVLESVKVHLADRMQFLSLLDWFWEQNWTSDELAEEETATWKELHGALIREHGLDNITLNVYLQEMDLKSKAALRPPDAIPCLTVHGAKGLEFKHVFLAGMAEEVFPSYQAVKKGESSGEMEEERRGCFVAITRVQESLTLTWAQSYNGWPKRPSRFLSEMGFKLPG